jgi:hypothetical protein
MLDLPRKAKVRIKTCCIKAFKAKLLQQGEKKLQNLGVIDAA